LGKRQRTNLTYVLIGDWKEKVGRGDLENDKKGDKRHQKKKKSEGLRQKRKREEPGEIGGGTLKIKKSKKEGQQ